MSTHVLAECEQNISPPRRPGKDFVELTVDPEETEDAISITSSSFSQFSRMCAFPTPDLGVAAPFDSGASREHPLYSTNYESSVEIDFTPTTVRLARRPSQLGFPYRSSDVYADPHRGSLASSGSSDVDLDLSFELDRREQPAHYQKQLRDLFFEQAQQQPADGFVYNPTQPSGTQRGSYSDPSAPHHNNMRPLVLVEKRMSQLSQGVQQPYTKAQTVSSSVVASEPSPLFSRSPPMSDASSMAPTNVPPLIGLGFENIDYAPKPSMYLRATSPTESQFPRPLVLVDRAKAMGTLTPVPGSYESNNISDVTQSPHNHSRGSSTSSSPTQSGTRVRTRLRKVVEGFRKTRNDRVDQTPESTLQPSPDTNAMSSPHSTLNDPSPLISPQPEIALKQSLLPSDKQRHRRNYSDSGMLHMPTVKMLFILGFFFGPWLWVIGGWAAKEEARYRCPICSASGCNDVDSYEKYITLNQIAGVLSSLVVLGLVIVAIWAILTGA